MKYHCLSAQRFATQDGFTVVPLRKQDIQKIREWRNAQLDILRQQTLLTSEHQETYYQSFIAPSFTKENPSIVLFSFLHEGECIGYGGLVHIDWIARRGEVSFLLDPHFLTEYDKYFKHFYELV